MGRVYHLILFLLLAAVILVSPLAVHANEANLRSLGVIVPLEKPAPGAKLILDEIVYVEASVDQGKVLVWPSYGRVLSSGLPGGPMLPALEYLVHVPRGYRAVVQVVPLSYHVVPISAGELEKLPPLLAFYARRQVLSLTQEELERAVYPSVLYLHYPAVVNGERFEKIIVYPVQYSEGKLVIIDAFRLRVWLEPAETLQSGPVTSKPVVLVLARDYKLAKFVAGLVEKAHPGVTVYPAGLENVTRLGKLLPLQMPISGILSPPRGAPLLPLLYGYNYTLAALIRGYVAWAHEHLGVNYLIIVGGASDIPPSYYYFSPLEYVMVGLYNAWIPTDFFYADLNLDFVPDVYVGRIPFSNVNMLKMYFEKVELYQRYQRRPSVLVIGSHPFNTAPPVAEAMMSTYTLRLHAFTHLESSFMTRVLGNYTVENFRRLFLNESQPAWILVIAHGLGSLWADYFYNKTLDMITPVKLLTSRDILYGSIKRDRLAVVTSVACINGAWDTDLVPPAFPLGVSIGEAIVESWGGVAYVGHSRVAFDWVVNPPVFNITNETVIGNFGGVLLLHGYFMKMWNEGARTLGEAIWKGAVMYLSDKLAGVIPDEPPIPVVVVNNTLPVSYVMVLELELLGDPLLQLPSPLGKSSPSSYPRIEGTKLEVNASVLYGPGLVAGVVPAFKPLTYENLTLVGVGIKAARIARIKNFMLDLYALESVTSLKTGKPLHLGGVLTGNLLIGVERGDGYLLMQAVAAGVGARYENGGLHIRAWDLGLVSAPFSPVYIYVDGDVARVVYNSSIDISIPYNKPGVHIVYAAPLRPIYSAVPIMMVAGRGLQVTQAALEEMLTSILHKLYSSLVTVSVSKPLSISIGGVAVVGSTLRIPVRVTLDGVPVKARVEAWVDGVRARVYSNGTGIYTVVAEGLKPGVHTILVKTLYNTTYIRAEGVTAASIVVDKSVAEAIRVVEKVNASITRDINYAANTLSEKITRRIASAETSIKNEILAESEKLADLLSDRIRIVESLVEKMSVEISKKLDMLNESLSATVKSGFESLASEMKTGLDEVKRSISDVINTKITEVEGRLEAINGKIVSLQDTLNQRLSQLGSSQVISIALTGLTLAAVIVSSILLGVRRG